MREVGGRGEGGGYEWSEGDRRERGEKGNMRRGRGGVRERGVSGE